MPIRLLSALALCLITFQTFAQSSTNYTVTTLTNGSLATDANGNTITFSTGLPLVQTGVSIFNSNLQPIGFPFYFMGKYYTHYIAGNDGQIALGISSSPGTMLSPTAANDLTRTVAYPPGTTDNAPVLAAFWDNLKGATTAPSIRYGTSGTAPYQCLTIDFNVHINTSAASGSAISRFQIRIYETTGVIEYVYGTMAIASGSGVVTASIGLTAGATDGTFLALQDLATGTFTSTAAAEPATQSLVNSSVAGNITALHSTADGSRKIFRFTPPVLSGTPLAGLQIGNYGATAASLHWTDSYSNELGYAIFQSADGINYNYLTTLPSNTNFYRATNLSLGTTYHWRVQPITEGNTAAYVSASVTTACVMSGLYQIGPGGHYPSITMALDSIKSYGITGNITLELMYGYAGSSETFPVRFPKNSELNCIGSKKILVRPSAGSSNLTISGTHTTALFILDSASYVEIDGRPGGSGNTAALSFRNDANAPVFQFNNASGNVIRYVNLSGMGGATALNHGLVNLKGTAGIGCDRNIFERMSFTSTDPANAKQFLFYASATGSIMNDRDSFRFCKFSNFSEFAVNGAAGTSEWYFYFNSFFSTTPINYAQDAGAIKLNEPNVTSNHGIFYNWFGGTTDGGLGNAMMIDHKKTFYFIDVKGKATIAYNMFRRIRFENTAPNTGDIYVAGIHAGDRYTPNQFQGAIIGNNLGTGGADSIHVTHNFSNKLFFALIFNDQGNAQIDSNNISNIYAWASTAEIELLPIFSYAGGSTIRYNNVGDPGIINSITNNSNGPTHGIANNGSASTITDNRICRISGKSTGDKAVVSGIYHAGPLDSLSRNEVFHLTTRVHNTSLGYALVGIIGFGSATWSGQNNVTNNKVYNLHNAGGGVSNDVKGIYLYRYSNVHGNLVHSLTADHIPGWMAYATGIEFKEYEGYVYNNMIRLGLDSLGNPVTNSMSFTGIHRGELVYHNTVLITGTFAGGTTGIGSECYFITNSAQQPYLYNNIFINNRNNTNAATQQHTLISGAVISDYNILVTSPGNYIGRRQFVLYQTLAQWRAATGFDQNSFQSDPMLVNPYGPGSDLNLHVQSGSPSDGAGYAFTYTTTKDFDGEIRANLTPVDIGADAGNFGCATGTPTPTISTNRPPSFCASNPLVLTSSATSGNKWYRNSVLIAGATSQNYTVSQTGSYTVTATSGSCVSATSAAVVVTAPAPIVASGVTISPSGPVCEGTPVTLTANTTGCTNCTYSWNGATPSTNPSTIVTSSGLHMVKIANGCDSMTFTVAVMQNAVPVINVSSTANTICAGNSATLTASGATTYTWSPSTGLNTTTGATVIASPATTTTYTVMGTTNGCSGITTKTITVNCTTGITAIDGIEQLDIGPNPAAGQTKLILDLRRQMQMKVELQDNTGRSLRSWTITVKAGKTISHLDLTGIAQGIYNITITTATGTTTRKIAVIR